MNRGLLSLSAVLVLITVCLGCESGGNPAPAGPNPFAGQWEGDWHGVGAAAANHGNMNFNVTETGAVAGTITSDGAGQHDGQLSGTIDNAGNFRLTAAFVGQSATLTGVLVRNGNNATSNFTKTVPGYGVFQEVLNINRI